MDAWEGPPQVICHMLPEQFGLHQCNVRRALHGNDHGAGYLSGAGEPGESSGTESRGVHQSLRVSNQLKLLYHRRL